MPFGLKNAPSEFQNIMNEIFNNLSDFSIVYIDDVLIYSESIDRRFKYLNTFLMTIKNNGLIISAAKTKLFQTKIRFLGHDIDKGKDKLVHNKYTFVQNWKGKYRLVHNKHIYRLSDP